MSRQRLSLEPLKADHAAHLYEAFRDQRLYRFIPQECPESLAALRAQFQRAEDGAPPGRNETWLNWAVRRADDGLYLGVVQATLSADNALWIGYKISPWAWGQGYATAAVALLVAALGQSFPGEVLLASVDMRHAASIRVLEKSGFVFLRQEAAELHGAATQDYVYGRQPSEDGP